mgnify:CR=1 FL=1
MELAPDDVLNVGTGIPNDVVGPIITEEGMSEDVTITVESGIYGGIPMGGIDFGIARNQFALVRHDDQFDYYNGPGVDVTYMGAGEVDAEGNVNATRLGQSPREQAVLLILPPMPSTWSSAPLLPPKGWTAPLKEEDFISTGGSLIKFVSRIKQVSYNAESPDEKGQKNALCNGTGRI